MDRREFLKTSALAAAGLALSPATASDVAAKCVSRKGFTLMQISSITDTIGNSYIIRTGRGSVVVMDGGFPSEAPHLRERLKEYGNHVDAWFLSHPHDDHIGAINEILSDRQGVTIDKIYYSSCTEEFLSLEQPYEGEARRLYKLLGQQTQTKVYDLHETGGRYDVGGLGIQVFGVSNPEFRNNPYNNSSMIIRIWDKTKSVLFLGDAGVECGNKAWEKYGNKMDSDYVQMAHHGQAGCSEEFYKNLNFRACLWPTPSWVWNPVHERLKTMETCRWMDEKKIAEHHVSCLEKDWLMTV